MLDPDKLHIQLSFIHSKEVNNILVIIPDNSSLE
jgi:hypothetical protein